MNHPTRRLLTLVTAVSAVVAAIAGWLSQLVGAASSFCPAYFQPGNPAQLTLFPLEGPAITIALPAGLPTNFRVITFSPDGKAIYGQKTEPLNRLTGIYKIEFQPARESVVPGSVGMGEMSCLDVSQLSGKVIVEGWSWSHNSRGILEIDPNAATSRPLPAGSASICGGAGGLISPDGKQAIIQSGKRLGLLDVKTREAVVIKGTSADMQCAWSPDGRWVAGVPRRKDHLA